MYNPRIITADTDLQLVKNGRDLAFIIPANEWKDIKKSWEEHQKDHPDHKELRFEFIPLGMGVVRGVYCGFFECHWHEHLTDLDDEGNVKTMAEIYGFEE